MLSLAARLVRARPLLASSSSAFATSTPSRAALSTLARQPGSVSSDQGESSNVQSSTLGSTLFKGLTGRRWDEPRLEQYILTEWPHVGEGFVRVRRRWLRKMRRDLAHRWPSNTPLDDKWYKLKENGELKLLQFIGHLGKEGKLDNADLLPLREAVLQRLVEDGLLQTSSTAPQYVLPRGDGCFNCGAIGHWKASCPEPLRVARRGESSLTNDERKSNERRLNLIEAGGQDHRRIRKARVIEDQSVKPDNSAGDWEEGRERRARQFERGTHVEGVSGRRPRIERADQPLTGVGEGLDGEMRGQRGRESLRYTREVGDTSEVENLADIEALVAMRSVLRAQGDLTGAR